MKTPDTVVSIMGSIAECAPRGCALALHFKFTSPAFLLQTYNAEWTAYYTQNSLVMRDPVVAWGVANTGARSWSSFADEDPAGVMEAAAEHGLAFGVVIAILENGSRSVCGFARDDREFTEAEIADLTRFIKELHVMTADEDALSEDDKMALRRLSAGATQPY